MPAPEISQTTGWSTAWVVAAFSAGQVVAWRGTWCGSPWPGCWSGSAWRARCSHR
ncbi:hypothetical protein [Amycolatopsis sp. WAC 01416]|uniref:hypothetical protein n=1 Tax=Amycolatopsis sp. WAC 01416 TaxID=2203196 RepID=UPI001315260F|nr:hypothetical protein [Amycolatopsis sp. WAC 01416]